MKPSKAVKNVGGILIGVGGLAFAAIFAVTLLGGGWPTFILPVKRAFQDINSAVGEAAFFVELMLFVGPGLLMLGLGEWLEDRPTRKR